MTDEQDREFLQEAQAALDNLYDKFHQADSATRWELRPQIEQAVTKLSEVRMALLKEGTLTKPEDLDRLRTIKQEIESAADKQAMVVAAARMIAVLATVV